MPLTINFINEPKGRPKNTYNNSIIEYGIESGATPIKSIISLGGYTFEIAPNFENTFYFNLKEIIKTLINQDHFDDTIEAMNGNYVFNDENLYLEVNIDFTIILSDASEATATKTYEYIKSVEQIVRKKVDTITDNELVPLAPYTDQTCNLTMFEGHPFDFSVYSNKERSIKVKNRRTGMETTLNLTKGVNRIYITNGVLSYGFEQELPLYIGVNELEFVNNYDHYFTLFLKKKESACGVYLKWFNQSGAWSYWRFSPIVAKQIKTKTIEKINTDYKNLYESEGNYAITGKEGDLSHKLTSDYIDKSEVQVLSEIFTSPKVLLYANEPLEPFEIDDFKVIDVDDGSSLIENTKDNLSEYQLKINLPKYQTQTL